MLRGFLTWLLVLGVLAGLSVRAVPELQEMGHFHPKACLSCGDHEAPPAAVDSDSHEHDGSCHLAEADSGPTESPTPSCPGHHHHHGCGCAPLNLSAEMLAAVRLSPPSGQWLGVGLADDRLPDAPVFEEDAPPLI
ncbi:hypothetical protein HNR46_001090 [Haloferula luteola]|uniref:Uncharacterized protein n=1 Tax=Haloferula luteola TaxID=595692 RepID=A0A840V1B5_9BACT|nr:hypothetical protein [Haloferula luteola]MBB5350856.1 hypothetical protein [Haloferula luteola]